MSDTQGKHETMTFDSHQLETLRTQLQGGVLVPGNEGYDKARQIWDVKTFDQHPAMIIMPANTSDVQTAVIFAREQNLPIGVQGGGHGHPYPVNDALLVNFANMTDIQNPHQFYRCWERWSLSHAGCLHIKQLSTITRTQEQI